MKQGKRANVSGKVLEGQVEVIFRGWFDLSPIGYREWEKNKTYPALVRNVPFTTLYGTQGRSEFVFYLTANVSMRIECKWQAVSGSVDEKYPYLLECMKRTDETHVIIICGGGGAKPQAIEWLQENAKGSKVHVFTSISDLALLIQDLIRDIDEEKGEQDGSN